MLIDRLRPASQFVSQNPQATEFALVQDATIESKSDKYKAQLQFLEQDLWKERARKTSTPERLQDLVGLSLTGFIVPSKSEDPTEKDAQLMESLVYTMTSLTDIRNCNIFEQWFHEKMTGESAKPTLYLLQSLIHTICLLDIDSYEQLTNVMGCPGSVLPLDTLMSCISYAKQNGNINPNNDTDRAGKLLSAQYQKVMEPRNEITENNYPDASKLGNALLPWINQQVIEGSVPFDKGLQAMLNYLEMHNAQNIDGFVQSLLDIDQETFYYLKKRAIEEQIIKAEEEERRQVVYEGLQETATRSYIDGNELYYPDLIGEGVKTLLCFVETGAFAPFHLAHNRTAVTVEELIKEKIKSSNGNISGLSYLVPACSSQLHARVSGKPAEQLGNLCERVNSIYLTTRGLQYTYVTTTLGEEQAKSGDEKMQIIRGGIEDTITQSYGLDKKEELPFAIKIIRVIGSDKLWTFDKNTQTYSLNVLKPEYKASLIKTRRKHLALTLLNLRQIRDMDNDATMVFTPDSPKGSSSEAIHKGDYTYFSLVTLAVENGYWDREAMQKRFRDGYQDDEIHSSTIYGKRLQARAHELLAA